MGQNWNPYSNLSTSEIYQSLISDQEYLDRIVELSKEYFEIAVGIRKPTKQERSQSAEITLSIAFGQIDRKPYHKIIVAKCPIGYSVRDDFRLFSTVEYAIFRLLAEETDIVDGPFIPMLRSEILKSKKDISDGNLDICLLRQSAFFETYSRMKLGRSRRTEWSDINFENIDTMKLKDIIQLNCLRELRDDYAHDWRVYLNELEGNEQLRKRCTTGLSLLSRLHKRELIKSYEENCTKSICQRYASEWSDRRTLEFDGEGSATVRIECNNCGHKFDPVKEGYKRCPECDTPHDYLSRFEPGSPLNKFE